MRGKILWILKNRYSYGEVFVSDIDPKKTSNDEDNMYLKDKELEKYILLSEYQELADTLHKVIDYGVPSGMYEGSNEHKMQNIINELERKLALKSTELIND
jgi:hypothetical protein